MTSNLNSSRYAASFAVQSVVDHQTAKLFEAQASIQLSRSKLSATVYDIERKASPLQLPPFNFSSWIPAFAGMTNFFNDETNNNYGD